MIKGLPWGGGTMHREGGHCDLILTGQLVAGKSKHNWLSLSVHFISHSICPSSVNRVSTGHWTVSGCDTSSRGRNKILDVTPQDKTKYWM